MPEPGLDMDAMLAALEAQAHKLRNELDGLQDDERREDISVTLSAIEEQKEHLREQRAQTATEQRKQERANKGRI
jgi:hypothetical protein